MAVAVPVSLAQSESTSGGTTAADAEVVKVASVPAKRSRVVRVKFRPWARPTPRQVRRIIRIEAKRWGISAAGLTRRVRCESNFRWNAGGTYIGLLQFAPSTFTRGLRTLRTRRVRVVKRSARKVWEKRLVYMSNGEKREQKVRKVRQRVKRIYLGRLPRRPAMTHGWTQIRIGAQAIAGKSAVRSSEWGCSA